MVGGGLERQITREGSLEENVTVFVSGSEVDNGIYGVYKEDQRSPLVVCLKQYPTFVLAHFGLKDIGVAASYLVSPLNLAVTY